MQSDTQHEHIRILHLDLKPHVARHATICLRIPMFIIYVDNKQCLSYNIKDNNDEYNGINSMYSILYNSNDSIFK